METAAIFLVLCVVCAIWNIVISLIVYDSLKKRGIPVSFLWLRVLAPKYACQYKAVTNVETGRVGPLFYHWIISINLALLFAIIAIISRL